MSFPAAAYISDNARTEGENKTAFEDWLKADKQIPGAGIAEQALTLSADTVTPAVGASGIIIIDTEAAAATDNFGTLVQTNMPDGSVVIVGLANAAHVVTVKHLVGGTGQISLRSAVDLVMSLTTQWLALKRTGTLWEELWRSGSEAFVNSVLVTSTVSADPLVALGIASQQYVNQKTLLSVMENGKLVVTMAANAVTIALKGNDGADPSASNPVRITFRSTALTDSVTVTRTITAALSTVISSGSTLGTTSTLPARIYVAALDNAGTVELCAWNAIDGTLTAYAPSESDLLSTTAEGGAGAADSALVPYSTTARTSKAFRVLGYFESTQTTAGTWATAASKIQLIGPGVRRSGEVVQHAFVVDGASATGTTTIPKDNTTPQNTEGDQYMLKSITPSSAINILEIQHIGEYDNSGANPTITACLFQDSTANALATQMGGRAAGAPGAVSLLHRMRAGTTSSTTMKIRAGSSAAGTTRFNGDAGVGALYNGTMASILSIKELFI